MPSKAIEWADRVATTQMPPMLATGPFTFAVWLDGRLLISAASADGKVVTSIAQEQKHALALRDWLTDTFGEPTP